MTLGLALLVMVVGGILYWIGNPKAAELGRIMFFCGLLVVLWSGGKAVHIG
jgi:Na+/phosphate symporter